MKASHTYVLICDQIYLNLHVWLTKKTIIEFNLTTIDREEEKENSSAKPFIYYTVASHFVYIPQIKSNGTNQTYLQRSHIQYNQITTRDSLNLCFVLFFVCFFLLHNTCSSEMSTDNIFLRDNHPASSTARYLWQQHIGQCRSEKKYVWPAQSQNNSWKQQLDN